MKSVRFLNLDCVELANDELALLLTQSVGPRVISLRFRSGKNLFAELPDFVSDTPLGKYHFYGGHRLWRAPEDLALTYQPDDLPVEIREIEHGADVLQPIESTGLQKSLTVTLNGSTVTLLHTLTNHSPKSVSCAPWAITQFKPGGIAILPHSMLATGFLPNRRIVLWPYTDVRNPHIIWGNRYTFIRANMTEGSLKIGFPNLRGWLAYWLAGTLFVKKAHFDVHAPYLDEGSSSECFCNDQFVELETLGGVVTLAEGVSVSHVERWKIFGDVGCPKDEAAAQKMVETLGLE